MKFISSAEDKEDLEIAESRMNDPQQETVGFEEFFSDLEA